MIDLVRRFKMELWSRSSDDPVRAKLKAVAKKLAKAYRKEAKRLIESPGTLAETEALHIALRSLTQARSAIDEMLTNEDVIRAEKANRLLAGERARLQNVIQDEKLDSYFQAGAVSVLAMNVLFLAEYAGNGDQSEPLAPSESSAVTPPTRMKITSDLLYQMHHNLFPAEKMLVASGKRNAASVEIGAVFEVTGKASNGHVHADRERLARALIAMDLTETHFALWVHSHPGTGKDCTRPSPTDLAQHKDWLQDYSADLVSAIMVQDRWIRFWGTALESGRLTLEVVGPGLIKEEPYGSVLRLEY
jgi:hypothetical protein